uniref:Uncharacterized protein n=1 Tax=Medicago truncatula TaxID=3880 RepID=I3SER9_MEDTR|nr:unknown [Medicago truncatula]
MVLQKKPKTEQMMMMIKLVDNYMFLSRWRISNSLLILFLMFMVLFLLLVLGILPRLFLWKENRFQCGSLVLLFHLITKLWISNFY